MCMYVDISRSIITSEVPVPAVYVLCTQLASIVNVIMANLIMDRRPNPGTKVCSFTPVYQTNPLFIFCKGSGDMTSAVIVEACR